MNEDYTKVLTFEASVKMDYSQKDLIDNKISSTSGMELLRWTPDYFKIKYYPHLYDESELISEFNKMGIKSRKHSKGSWLNNFLNTIAKENKKSFGDHRLDCCDLGKD